MKKLDTLVQDIYDKIDVIADGKQLDVVSEYQYLNLKLKSSGIFTAAVDELNTKASRAYFSISNLLYSHKKWPIERAVGMYDTIVTPVSLYACELWAPLILPKKSFRNRDSVMAAWQTFKPELLNQKVCRLLLGVHSKTSRLAILGELGRFPQFVKAITHAIKYNWHIENKVSKSSLVSLALEEMKQMEDIEDGWYTRIQKNKKIFSIPEFNSQAKSDTVGSKIKRQVESQFSIYWKSQISFLKIGDDGLNHNKLRMYQTLKSSFTLEPYINLVLNRNQRSSITRFRTSAHLLRVELGRYTVPKTPLNERTCIYCVDNQGGGVPFLDDEFHCLMVCPTFTTKRNCLFGKISAFDKNFAFLTAQHQMLTLLCPSNKRIAQLVNKFISIVIDARKRIDKGESMDRGNFTDFQLDDSAVSDSDSDTQV